MSGSSQPFLELYKLELAHVQHENSLVNNRTTWFVQFTAFLLTAYAVTGQAFVKPEVLGSREGILQLMLSGGCMLALILAAAGLAACVSTIRSVGAAYEAMAYIDRHWKGACQDASADPNVYPPLLGGGNDPVATSGRRLGVLLPRVMIVLWGLLAIVPAMLLIEIAASLLMHLRR